MDNLFEDSDDFEGTESKPVPDIDEIPGDDEIPGEYQLEDEGEEDGEKDGGYSPVVPACFRQMSTGISCMKTDQDG
jgi:hypothetical protein